MSIELEKAVDIIKSNVSRLEAEVVTVLDAMGRVLSADIVATIDQPPFNRSPLDGYALKASDSLLATRQQPVLLKIVETVFAGEQSRHIIKSGEAIRIMTGSPLPAGCDCVIRQEDTVREDETVKVFQKLKPYQNYCYQGEDFKRGERLFLKGSKMDAVTLAVCASAGLEKVSVISKPRVAVISTGDELIKPGTPRSQGQIYDANSVYLSNRLKQLGIEVSSMEVVEDKINQIAKSLQLATLTADLIITTGGVSVGERDFIFETIEKLNGEIQFHGINLKPGSPAMFSLLGKVPVLSLSGNPFACATTFELLARPLLNKMCEDPQLLLKDVKAQLVKSFSKPSPKRRFIRGVFNNGCVDIPEGNSSGQLRSMIGCNCLVDIAPGSGPVRKGSNVSVKLL